jgi:Arc/MetJ-type ribon-helix-helix transcriptional regulator
MSWPTTDDPRTEFITLRLTVSEAKDLDAHVKRMGFKSRSAAVRNATERVIAAEKRRAEQAKKTK